MVDMVFVCCASVCSYTPNLVFFCLFVVESRDLCLPV
jgi:hypothetical protein